MVEGESVGGVFGDRHKLGDIPIVWQLVQGSGVDGHTHRVVVCDQPLESSKHHCTSDTEVPMALVGPLLPDNNDIQFRGKAGQTLKTGGHILSAVVAPPGSPLRPGHSSCIQAASFVANKRERKAAAGPALPRRAEKPRGNTHACLHPAH